MKKNLYRAFSVLLIVVLLVSSIAFSFAVGPVVEYVAGTFFDAVAGEIASSAVNYVKDHIGYSAGKQCKSSSDGYHHCESAGFAAGKLGTDEDGRYSLLKCTYCGEMFKYYSSFSGGHGGGFGKSDLQQSYEAQVEELPAQNYKSDGGLILTVPILKHQVNLGRDSAYVTLDCLNHTVSSVSGPASNVTFSCSSSVISGSLRSGCSQEYLSAIEISTDKYIIPYSGFYKRLGNVGMICQYYAPSSDNFTKGTVQNFWPSNSSSVYYDAGHECSDSVFKYVWKYCSSFRIECYPLMLEFTPAPDSGFDVNTTYNINSRPTSITGDYGIIGDNGQIIKVEGDKIVNETNNTYYNPSTGETKTMSDWSYNYEDRSYTVTTESGDTVTITYGDENVTIKEGDTIYNVYYLVDGSGSENPDPGPDVPPACNHQWTETSATPATCTVPGSRSLACSLCNETKTETIPAPGHKWVIRQTINTEYDEEGNKTQDGYTIFECSVCGEQYKSTDGTAPPGGGSGTGSGSSGGVFSGIFGLLVDFLGFFWNTFRDFVGEGVRGFLNALMDGTSSIFGLLNPFDWGG